MNKLIKILSGLAVFGAGFAAGYFVRKKTEVTFEVVSEEELDAIAEEDAQNASQSLSEPQEGPSTPDVEEEIKEMQNGLTEHSEGIGEGQKIAYFKQWKAEETRAKYDTRTKEEPENVIAEVEDIPDSDFMQSIEEDILSNKNRPEIEPANIEEWNHWVGTRDGEYDPIEILWYEGDNVFCDSEDQVMDRPEKFIGFDIRKQFEKISDETTGDPDVRVLYNHRWKAIYHVTRINGSWGDKKKMEEFGGDAEDDEEEDPYDRFRGLRN